MPDSGSTPPAASSSELAFARDLMVETGKLTLRWFGQAELEVDDKSDGTPVTEADLAAERFVRERLAVAAPADSVVGEEEDDTHGTSERRWYVDPIDGTHGFTKGVPLYANLLALYDSFGPVLGVINLPATSEVVYAGRGLGCFCNGELVSVSQTSALSEALVTASGYEYFPEELLGAVRRSGASMRTWGDGYGYAMVASGRADVMVDYGVSPWDLAPIPVILSEAGGRFSSWTGDPGIDSPTGLGSNGLLHDEVLALMA
ncbi:MAG: inositol monophosphatase [Acidimicrobiales bacterium]